MLELEDVPFGGTGDLVTTTPPLLLLLFVSVLLLLTAKLSDLGDLGDLVPPSLSGPIPREKEMR